jgi:hypothetical protein
MKKTMDRGSKDPLFFFLAADVLILPVFGRFMRFQTNLVNKM